MVEIRISCSTDRCFLLRDFVELKPRLRRSHFLFFKGGWRDGLLVVQDYNPHLSEWGEEVPSVRSTTNTLKIARRITARLPPAPLDLLLVNTEMAV